MVVFGKGPVFGFRRRSGDNVLAPFGSGCEDPMVGHEVSTRPRDEGGELFDELEGLEEDGAGAVFEWSPEDVLDAAVFRLEEPVLGDGAAGHISADPFKASAIPGRDADICVEGEASDLGAAPSCCRMDRGESRDLACALDGGSSVLSQGNPALNGGGVASGEERLCVLFAAFEDLVVSESTSPMEQSENAASERFGQIGDVVIARRRECMKDGRLIGGGAREDPIEDERVEVDVEIESAAEALHDVDGTGPSVAESLFLASAAQESQDRAEKEGAHGGAELWVVGQKKPDPKGKREDPLADGHARQDPVDEVGGGIGHASAAARRAETASFARERDESVFAAVLATDPDEALCQDAAIEEGAKLFLHE